MRLPAPHSGALRKAAPSALPCETLSAKPTPISCSATSLNGLNVTRLWLVNGEFAVVWVIAWQAWQPMVWNTFSPRVAAADGTCTGAADKRMKAAKLTMSDEKSAARLPVDGLVPSSLVGSSGNVLNWQFGSSSRSLGKFSLVTPCSTL